MYTDDPIQVQVFFFLSTRFSSKTPLNSRFLRETHHTILVTKVGSVFSCGFCKLLHRQFPILVGVSDGPELFALFFRQRHCYSISTRF